MPRLPQGANINKSGSRSQLAISYDTSANAVVTRAIRAFQLQQRTRGPGRAAWITVDVASPAGDPVDAGGLTAHERAFTQAVNYERRVYRHGTGGETVEGVWVQNPNPDRTHSVTVRWDPPRYTSRGRVARVRVFTVPEASRFAAAQGG